jgi:uncharacterized membrane protein
MDLLTFEVLDLNLPTPFKYIKVLQEPTIFSSNTNIDVIDIYPLLNAISVRLLLLDV